MLQSWDDIRVGTETGAIDMVVTDDMVDEYLAAVELDEAALAPAADGEGRIAPPDMVPKLTMRTLFIDYTFANIGPSVRAKQAYRFLKPVRVGTRVRAVGRISDKYERRGKRFVAFQATYVDADGTPLIQDDRAIIVLADNFKIKG